MKKYANYFQKAPKGNMYITEMRRCVAHELLKKGYSIPGIGAVLYGYKLRWNAKYLVTMQPENQEVIENWKSWIKDGVYPITVKQQVKAEPMTKKQREEANSKGNIFVTKNKIKLV